MLISLLRRELDLRQEKVALGTLWLNLIPSSSATSHASVHLNLTSLYICFLICKWGMRIKLL